MVVEELINADDKPTVMRALLLRHRHVNEHSHSGFPFVKRKYSSYTSLQVRKKKHIYIINFLINSLFNQLINQ